MTYQQALNYLNTKFPQYQKIGEKAFKPSLKNIKKLCEYLNNPETKFPSIHIAGTNGKGSSAHMIASVLQTVGYKTGLYTSPHLLSFRERIKINGKEISEESVVTFVENYQGLFEEIDASFFEITVLMAFWHFANQQVDIAVIEVGLGGRFDATNVITPLISLITNIGYDHQSILGDTLPKIAFEKAGIIKKNVPVVISERQKEVEDVFLQKAKEMQADIFFAENEFQLEKNMEENFNIFKNNKVYIENLTPSLKGIYQQKNILGVCKTLAMLKGGYSKINAFFIKEGLEKASIQTKIQGRWQIIQENPITICDTAHNQEGIEMLVQDLLTQNKILHIILGFAKDKRWKKLLNLFPKNACYYFCQFDATRSLSANLLFEEAKSQNFAQIKYFQTVYKAFGEAEKIARKEELIFIGGSSFVVAEFLKHQKNLHKA